MCVSSDVRVRTRRVGCVANVQNRRRANGSASVRFRRHNKNLARSANSVLCAECTVLRRTPKIVVRPSSAAAAKRFRHGGGGRCITDGRAGGRRSVWRTANQTQKQYNIFQAIMLCASEILLRIYVIINCIKQISILLDTEGAFGFHLGTSDTVSFTWWPYRGSSYPSVGAIPGGKWQLIISPRCYIFIFSFQRAFFVFFSDNSKMCLSLFK